MDSTSRTLPSSPSPSPPSVRSKRALSDASQSSNTSKRRAESVSLSDTEGSLGASRLQIGSTPNDYSDPDSPSSFAGDVTMDAATTPSGGLDEDALPAYDDGSQAPEGSGPDGQNQLDMIKEMKRGNEIQMEQGDEWFLVSRTWYRRWATACSGVSESKDDDDSITLDDVGRIDNSDILTAEGKLKQPLEVGRDVEILPAPAWDFLVRWYGRKQAPIQRIAVGPPGQERVEFYPPVFHLLKLLPSSSSDSSNVAIPPFGEPPSTTLSSAATLKDLKDFATESFSLQRSIRFWRLPESSSPSPDLEGPAYIFAERIKAGGSELIERDGITDQSSLSEALLTDPETRLAVEEQDALGNWIIDADALRNMPQLASGRATPEPTSDTEGGVEKKKHHFGIFGHNKFTDRFHHHAHGAAKSKNKDSSAAGSRATPIAVPTTTAGPSSLLGLATRSKGIGGRQRGLTGLQNLGNTCFMNSALQCMSNTKELQEYFASGVYKDELNRDNPLGMGGQVAEAFGQLIERLWASSGSSVAPREFKQALSRFAPQFSGYGQQDTQELLAFLLDGVHEDLNRIKKKPATSAPDWMGGGDKELVELAQTCWEQYRSRNDSVIVDLFQGQYRSTVVCPDCDKVSITFDPFMYVTTSIPVHKKWTGKVYFVPLDPSKDRYSIDLEMPKNSTLKHMKSTIGKLMDVDPQKLVCHEEYKNRIWRIWYDDELVTEIGSSDVIVFFEVSDPYPQPQYRPKAKAAEPVKDSNSVVVTIYHKRAKSGMRGGRGSFGSTNEDNFGSPLLVTMSKEEASTTAGIQMALAKQYSRLSKRGAALVESVQGQIEAEESPSVSAPAPVATAVPPPPPADVTLPATPPPKRTSMDVDSTPSASTSKPAAAEPTHSMITMPAPPAVIPDSLSAPAPATIAPSAVLSSTSTDIPSTSTAETTRAPKIWSLFVPQRTARPGTIAQDKEDFRENVVPLLQRVRRESTPETDMFAAPRSRTTLPGSFYPPEDDSSSMSTDTEADNLTATSATATTGESTPALTDSAENGAEEEPIKPTPKPLIRTGDFIIVEWEPAAVVHFFGANGGGDQARWGDVVAVVDPAIAASRLAQGGPKKTITIQDCLTEFTKEERLGEDDTWYCPVCKDHKQATKKVELWKVPDILVFAFKRFGGSNRYSRDKIEDFVDFPLENFNLEPFVEGAKVERRLAGQTGEEDPESLIYDLYAVDNHYGGMGGGHYTAYAKNHENSKWYDFDDGRVSEISNPERVKTKAAYLVMYRRRTTRPIGAKTRELIDSAIQSRTNSRTTSEAGGPAPVLSKPNSPFGSSDNLVGQARDVSFAPSDFSTFMSGSSFNNANDDEEDLYGGGDLSRTYVPSNRERYAGLYNRGSPSSDADDSDNGAVLGSGPNSRAASPPPDEHETMSYSPLEDGPAIDLDLDDQLDEQVPTTTF